MAGFAASTGRLKAFLVDPARAEGTLRYHEAQGFIFAIASAPDIVMPSEWMPLIFGGEEPEYASLAEVKAVVGGLMAMYNDTNAAVLSGSPALPPGCAFRRRTLANFDTDAPVSEWARGFVLGHEWLAESWDEGVPAELDEPLGIALMALCFFATPRLAEMLLAETGKADLRELAGAMRRIFPHAMAMYAEVGRTMYRARLSEEAASAPAACSPRHPKPSRNDPCYCGSGRKYKKCHGAG